MVQKNGQGLPLPFTTLAGLIKMFQQKLISKIKPGVAFILPLFKKNEGCVDNE